MRVFLAVNLPKPIQQSLGKFITEARQMNNSEYIKWVKPESLHLTLHFLDEQNDQAIKKITEICLNTAKEFKPVDIRVGDWGGFPSLDNPRILFVNLNDSEILVSLHKALGRSLQDAGFQIDKRPWKTHVTVSRNKSPRPAKLHLPQIGQLKWTMKSFELMKSVLLPDGAEYVVLESFEL